MFIEGHSYLGFFPFKGKLRKITASFQNFSILYTFYTLYSINIQFLYFSEYNVNVESLTFFAFIVDR